jgi:methionine synthase II (cobalamin-independent)
MAVTDPDVTKFVKALGPVIREEIKQSNKAQAKALKATETRLHAEIKSTKTDLLAQDYKIIDIIEVLTNSLDNVYASKKTVEEVEEIRAHLHATP